MIVLGLILLIVGLLFAVNLITAIGLVLILVGLVVNFVPSAGAGPLSRSLVVTIETFMWVGIFALATAAATAIVVWMGRRQ